MTARGCQGCIRQCAPSGARPRQSLLPQHSRRIQTFDNDTAVGFGQSCCQHVQVVGTDIVDPTVQPGQFGGALTVAA
ncbi:Uncharacterised protein [Mycobacterium tuberculosis]|uniref:Uncharacterized protein n=1 Tax=Mycobacterium tuberculosis TaxID=1773 RepID=A0A655JNQ9_MYCTX|nr:Uncharacterised protein [Mycobacterium tuberculosis]COX26519.1 Uncharacterised protein [Mycobacterium tuberculosis]